MSKRTMKGILCALAVGLVMASFGQSTTDHPTLKGNNARTGVNGDVANSGPGALRNQVGGTSSSSLRWFTPFVSQRNLEALRLNEINPFKTLIDNTDDGAAAHVDSGGNPVGPYDPLPNGVATSTGTWVSPLEFEEADNAKTVAIRRNQNPANVAPYDTLRNYNPRFAAHLWAATTASLGGISQDPRQAIVPANLSTFSWVFSPRISTLVAGNFVVSNDPTPKGYALYVWIPEGLVRPGGVERPKLRYWAYEITYGFGQKYVDVVDTFASGTGWVRLGNNGRPTNQLFYYAGLDGLGNPYPITIKLYNTITRDTQDQLTETVTGVNPDNRFSVYADAALFSAETDSYSASPTSAGFGTTDVRVIGAKNNRTIDQSTMPAVNSTNFKAKPTTISKGIVTSYDYNTGNPRWTYNIVDGNEGTALFDDTNVRVIPTAGFTPAVDNPNAQGGGYLKGTAGPAATENVTIDPDVDLGDGSYDVYMWVGGDQGTNPVYAKAAQYEVFEGGVSAGTFSLDMSQTAKWVRIGNRRFKHSTANRLRVVMSNRSDVTADAGKSVYVDQFMFVGSTGTDVKSTPIHARAYLRLSPDATPIERDVIIIADEGGRLRCLDAIGNADGTTDCYWTYPSIRDAADDPNLQPGQDTTDPNNGTFQKFDGEDDALQATMPTDFDLSTGVVQRLTVNTPGGPQTHDYLIIGSKNGRITCIDMMGRGDFNFATDTPGTAFRSWSYPPTYPAAVPQTSKLGQVSSVISANLTIAGNPTDVVIVATEQGRIFCLNAIGDFNYTSGSELTTNVIWQYPPATVDTLPAIYGAPALDVANGRLFIGTVGDDEKPSRFMALDATTGNPLWATANNSIVDGLATPPEQLDWLSGPAYVPATQLNSLPSVAAAMPDTVYALNQNGYLYAINANTGDVIWRTDELQGGGLGSLIYTEINTFGPTGTTGQYPVIMVGTSNGRFAAVFARLGEETRFGNRVAWGYEVDANIEATMTSSNKWLYGATGNGYLLAWSDLLNAGSILPDGFNGPGNETVADNDTAYDSYRTCEVAFLSRAGFQALRRVQAGTTTGTENFGTVIDALATYTKPLGRVRPPFASTHGAAYEWGETIYLIAYNFPAPQSDSDGDDTPPPVVEATVTTGGRTRRPVTAEARLFADKTSADPDGGYAIFAIPLTAGGESSYAPGPGKIRCQIRTAAVNGNGTMQSITLDPTKTQLDYAVANPLAISVEEVYGTDADSTLGITNDPAREDSLMNGSKSVNVTGIGVVRGDLFGKSVGATAHGGTKKTIVTVLDRSLITFQRGEGRGLDNVRVDRRDLRWMGGTAAMVKPFGAHPGLGGLLGNFEDLPTLFPNISLDYPDVQREQVKVRKEPNGNVENPVFNGVSLNGPRNTSGGYVTEADAANRVMRPTVFEFQVDIPRYQPVNLGNNSIPNQNSGFWSAGYVGRFTVYVDSDQTGVFGGERSEAYRSFNLASAVSPDERIVIGTPSVDLGSLAGGAGYDTGLTYSPGTAPYRVLNPTALFNPDSYSNMFKSFTAFNEGNVNLWNVRLAKGTVASGTYWPWMVLSQSGNDDIWLDSATDVHSDLDSRFAPEFAPGVNTVIVQKPRVTDTTGRQLKVNPTSRLNPNIPGSGTLLLPAAPQYSRDPRISVTPPLGTPVGRYSQIMRLLEDTAATSVNDESLLLRYSSGTAVAEESFSDPSFTLTFAVKETQLTGGRSQFAGAGVHEGNPVNPAAPAQWNDSQPAGMRMPNGDLLMAFSSNRPEWYPAAGNPNPATRNSRIFLGTLTGGTMGAPDARGMDSQLRDLNKFVPADPANGRWFSGNSVLPNVADNVLFSNTLTDGMPSPVDIGGTLTGEVSYQNPAFSSSYVGRNRPLVYVGNAKRQLDNRTVTDSRIIVTELDSSNVPGTTVSLDVDPFTLKGRPQVIHNGPTAEIFFSGQSNGISALYRTVYTMGAGFSPVTILKMGNGFESVNDPSVIQRLTRHNGNLAIETNLVFSGRVRSGTNNELFLRRYDATTFDVIPFGNPTLPNGQIVETPVYDAKFGGFRTRGMDWGNVYTVTLANGTPIFTSAATIERQTRMHSYATIYGGRAIVDVELGVIRFTGATLPKTLQLSVVYNPNILRINDPSTSGYTTPSAVWDPRLMHSNTASSYAFWKLPSGAEELPNSTNTYSDRLVVASTRSTTAGGQTMRPVMATYRLGVRLGRPIAVNPDGTLAEVLTVSGNTGSYQIDPAGGRIYFTNFDEDRVVTINHGGNVINRPVTFIGETRESFISIENALNEANINISLDPMSTSLVRRNLIWMFWSSTRNGSSSLYMQTVAPKLTPVLPSQ